MVSVLQPIRLGPGAALLSKDVKRIHMDFAVKLNDGHLGPRRFWRNYLPRLKYHNPAVPMTVNRTTDQDGPATLTVFFAPPSGSQSPTSSPAPTSSTSQSTLPSEHTPFERAESINMKHKREPEILALLMEVTKATPVEATPEEQAELQELEEQSRRSETDSRRSAEVNEKRQREANVLAQARGDLAEAQAQAA
ncbi:MAG: hypothetical protein M1830_008755 [Pleopsidium flavum]|nr:MAG: hypothetical protein M1830_008755 [Pleopsidium flavum]